VLGAAPAVEHARSGGHRCAVRAGHQGRPAGGAGRGAAQDRQAADRRRLGGRSGGIGIGRRSRGSSVPTCSSSSSSRRRRRCRVDRQPCSSSSGRLQGRCRRRRCGRGPSQPAQSGVLGSPTVGPGAACWEQRRRRTPQRQPAAAAAAAAAAASSARAPGAVLAGQPRPLPPAVPPLGAARLFAAAVGRARGRAGCGRSGGGAAAGGARGGAGKPAGDGAARQAHLARAGAAVPLH